MEVQTKTILQYLLGIILAVIVAKFIYKQAKKGTINDDRQSDKRRSNYQIDATQFNSDQLAKLNILHDKAKETFAKFVAEAEAKTGWKVLITSSYRDFAHQVRLKQENQKNATPGLSWHNYGLAIDINLTKGNKRVKKADSRATWESTGVPQIAAKYGLFWGVNIPNYHDPVHFDMSPFIKNKYNLDTKDLLAKAKEQFGYDPYKIQGNKIKL